MFNKMSYNIIENDRTTNDEIKQHFSIFGCSIVTINLRRLTSKREQSIRGGEFLASCTTRIHNGINRPCDGNS